MSCILPRPAAAEVGELKEQLLPALAATANQLNGDSGLWEQRSRSVLLTGNCRRLEGFTADGAVLLEVGLTTNVGSEPEAAICNAPTHPSHAISEIPTTDTLTTVNPSSAFDFIDPHIYNRNHETHTTQWSRARVDASQVQQGG